jgi:hypothetical protein
MLPYTLLHSTSCGKYVGKRRGAHEAALYIGFSSAVGILVTVG